MAILFASDYDGTIRRKQQVSDNDLQAINDFQVLGHNFAIVTGRSLGMIKNELAHYQLKPNYLIANNGGIIVDKNYQVIYRNDISFDIYLEIAAFLQAKQEIFFGVSDGEHFGNIKMALKLPPNRDFNPLIGAELTPVDQILAKKKINSFFVVTAYIEVTKQLMQELESLFGDKVAIHINNGTIDINGLAVNKCNGILKLQKYLNNEEVYVIGDGYNDLSMISYFKGFAVNNAVPEVLAIASQIFGDVTQALEFLLTNKIGIR